MSESISGTTAFALDLTSGGGPRPVTAHAEGARYGIPRARAGGKMRGRTLSLVGVNGAETMVVFSKMLLTHTGIGLRCEGGGSILWGVGADRGICDDLSVG